MDQQLNSAECGSFEKLLKLASEFSDEHSVAIGVAEMAVGAALLHWGVQTGALQMGVDLVGTASIFNVGEAAGSLVGGSMGAVAGYLLGGIGIAGAFGAVGIPAIFVSGGAALVFTASGYVLGDLVFKLLHPFDLGIFATGASVIFVGAAMLLHGSQRVLGDEGIQDALSSIKDRCLQLGNLSVPVIALTLSELNAFSAELVSPPTSIPDAAGSATALVGGGVAGAMIGSSAAAASVTVAGSSTLGSVALALGLVSAPIWPVVVGTVGVAAGAYVTWKTAKLIAVRQST